MDDPSVDKIPSRSSTPDAFILYRSQTAVSKEEVSYNQEAWRILSLSALPSKEDKPPFPPLSSLCARWKELLDKRLDEQKDSGKEESGVGFIDLYQSHRRRYGVRGLVLSDRPSASENPQRQYLFFLERISPEGANLSLISRQWHLNRREQEVVRLLLVDKSNKEIAHTLGLSLNTIKGYMKLLMRRLGVSSRSGIVARLLTGRNTAE